MYFSKFLVTIVPPSQIRHCLWLSVNCYVFHLHSLLGVIFKRCSTAVAFVETYVGTGSFKDHQKQATKACIFLRDVVGIQSGFGSVPHQVSGSCSLSCASPKATTLQPGDSFSYCHRHFTLRGIQLDCYIQFKSAGPTRSHHNCIVPVSGGHGRFLYEFFFCLSISRDFLEKI